MPVTLDDDIFDELVRAYRARTGEEPAAAYLDVFRMEAEWQAMDQAERERRAAEKLKALQAIRAGFPPLSRQEKDAIWEELERVNEELFEEPSRPDGRQ